MENPKVTQETEVLEIDHFQQLIDDYGLTDQNNTVMLWQHDSEAKANVLKPFPIFEKVESGISIMPYTLDRMMLTAAKRYKVNGKPAKVKGTPDGERKPAEYKDGPKETYKIIRLHPERLRKNGEVQKYHIPPGAGTPPLFPVQLVDAFEKAEKIDTLYITEGYKKAFKACNDGLPCIGLVSITCMIDKETEKLHRDIVRLIDKCKVKRVVYLIDADFREITSKDITEGKELATRPNNFYNTICKIQVLLSGVEDIGVYFAHISETIEGNPKGLDDLLIEHKENKNDIVKEALQFNKINQGRHEGNYFVKFNITQSPYKLRQYFMLHDVTVFYLHHIEKRPELKEKQFRFFGTLYKYNGEKCEIIVPKDANNYFRVGDDYNEYIDIPNRYGELTRTFHNRAKSTITDDHGKDIIKHIPKFKAFCNVPNHLNYQRVINGCFNTYAPFLHEPEEGDISSTAYFLKHIFGENKITLKDGTEVEYWELGLDYIQILLKQPQQVLPILCLVSKERRTGKTTFSKWLKQIFTENMAIVGNQDFENAFNAHWISKLLVCVDETKIEKDVVVEKIKSLSTANNTMLNSKGKNQIEIEIFLKFLLLSNNEDNFINIDKDEIRFWVLKIKSIPEGELNLDLENAMIDEIPAFINFLNNRKLVTKKEERHWFHNDYLQTDILKRIKENSQPSLWRLIRYNLKEKFEDFPDCQEIRIPLKELKEYIVRNPRFEESYIDRVLSEMGYKRDKNQRGDFPHTRYATEAGIENTELKKWIGRPFTFKRSDFIEEPHTEQSDLPL